MSIDILKKIIGIIFILFIVWSYRKQEKKAALKQEDEKNIKDIFIEEYGEILALALVCVVIVFVYV